MCFVCLLNLSIYVFFYLCKFSDFFILLKKAIEALLVLSKYFIELLPFIH